MIHGNGFLVNLSKKEIKSKILSRVRFVENGCLEWTGGKTSNGYGVLSIRFKKNWRLVSVHRLSFYVFSGKLKKGLVIDHVCRNKLCLNPSHLRQVTQRINTIENSISQSAKNYRKTHCCRGHEFSKNNTYEFLLNGRTIRQCRECFKIRHTKRLGEKKEKKAWSKHEEAALREMSSVKTVLEIAKTLNRSGRSIYRKMLKQKETNNG